MIYLLIPTYLGEHSQKKLSQIGEKVHKGGGGQIQNQKSLHFKCIDSSLYTLLYGARWLDTLCPNSVIVKDKDTIAKK